VSNGPWDDDEVRAYRERGNPDRPEAQAAGRDHDGSWAVAGLALVILAAVVLLRGWAALATALGIGG
jgi:hypothetical protein